MRCASVAGVTRNARAISSVVRPQISRSVSATCPSGARAGMATSEDQTEAIILDLLVIFTEGSVADARLDVGNNISLHSIEARAPAHDVDGFEACGGNQPGARIVWNTSPRPRLQRGGERLMHGLFGEVQISQEAHERRQNPARFRSVESVNGRADVFGHRRRHLRQTSRLKK